MSINDLLESDTFLPTIFIVFLLVMIVAIPIGLAVGKKTNDTIYGDDEYDTTTEENNAKVLARRTSPHPLNQTIMINMVVFELENGNRVELAIKDPNIYGIMVEGDCGTLKYTGKKFIGFERNT